MKILKIIYLVFFLYLICFETSFSYAQNLTLPNLGEAPSRAVVAKEALKRDAVCTGCHDESETAPILSIYQTKHGVRGDTRTPTCQSCHGESDKHVKGVAGPSGRTAPDVVFKKGVYALTGDKERSAQCLTCHSGSKRSNWDGAAHQNNGVACNSCHQVHRPMDKVLAKVTQPDVCFTCHKDQRADTKKISHHQTAIPNAKTGHQNSTEEPATINTVQAIK